jgi:ATP-dependent DNA helicase RecQ
LSSRNLVDATLIAQKFLSAVARLNEKFGAGYIIDVLRGSNSEKIREAHKKLTVYGIGKDLTKDEWHHYAKELLYEDYLQQSNSEYPVLQLTEKSKAVLFKGAQAFLNAATKQVINKEPMIFQQHAYEKELFENLKKLRNQIAHEENIPAYIIFSDSSLLDLATYLPLKRSDLSHISGFGEFKIERYGNAFLEMVQDYCIEHQMPTRMDLKGPLKKKPLRIVKEKETDTKKQSYEKYQQGNSIEEIAATRGLSPATIELHLSYYIQQGKLSLDEFVKIAHQVLIQKAVEKHGRLSLRILKDNLPDTISYAAIRMVLNALPVNK